MSISTMYFFFAFCNMTFDFLLVRLWYGFSFEICLLGKIVALLFGLELFESMRNIAVRNSPAFSYPLPVLVRVCSNLLIIK